MDASDRDDGPEQAKREAVGSPEGAGQARPGGGRLGPTWRAWLLSIVAAIVLSVAATLILGGSFRPRSASNAASGACGAGSASHSCPLEGASGHVVSPDGRTGR